MKRNLVIVMCLCMTLFVLVACSNGSPKETITNSTDAGNGQPPEKPDGENGQPPEPPEGEALKQE